MPTPMLTERAPETRRNIIYNFFKNTNYGPVNNINHVENAYLSGWPAPSSRETSGSSPMLGGNTTTNPPHGFVLFGFAFIKSQYDVQSGTLANTAIHRVIVDTWDRLGAEEKARVENEAERADELHMAMELDWFFVRVLDRGVGSCKAGSHEKYEVAAGRPSWYATRSAF
ncbi:hypothetical protein FA13DRAFT_1791485 [Coprinellus micaceus]|uniref:HMG box domain-containing protein n=1 Tax=Coprinellus micaceus TaxID=71717 RepID=A0A4Y7TC46_COPMI|nr:hypothetical protein FA13DRAFT_1791485 [Coprinellus micaceus]